MIVLLGFVHAAIEPGGRDDQTDQNHRHHQEAQIQEVDVDLLGWTGAVLDLGVGRQVVNFSQYVVLADVDQPTVESAILVYFDVFENFRIDYVLWEGRCSIRTSGFGRVFA